MKSILLVAGDPSADLHGANLIRQIKRLSPESKVTCLGGLRMAEVADRFLYNLVELAVFGVGDTIRHYFLFRHIFREIVLEYINKEKPCVVVPIDFYGFNIHLARAAKERKIPVIYYISPQVWASRPGRVKKLSRYVTKMLVILPFEEEIYRAAEVDTVFVGHPLLDVIPANPAPSSSLACPAPNSVRGEPRPCHIGLLPGSRKAIIARHLPLLIEIAQKIKTKFPESQFFLPWTRNVPQGYLAELLKKSPTNISLVYDEDYQLRQKLSFAIACSGTATLENALLGIPTIIIYKTTWFFYFLARSLVKLPYIGLVNILAGKNLLPEFIQEQAQTDKIVEKAVSWLENRKEWENIHEELLNLRKRLGQPGASRRAAEEILKCINVY